MVREKILIAVIKVILIEQATPCDATSYSALVISLNSFLKGLGFFFFCIKMYTIHLCAIKSRLYFPSMPKGFACSHFFLEVSIMKDLFSLFCNFKMNVL